MLILYIHLVIFYIQYEIQLPLRKLIIFFPAFKLQGEDEESFKDRTLKIKRHRERRQGKKVYHFRFN